MINFQEFEIFNLYQSDKDQEVFPNLTKFSYEHQKKLSFETVNSIHEENVQDIQQLLSSIEHSENLLDQMAKKQQYQESFNDNCEEKNREVLQENQKLRLKNQRRLKNETKNIPKNFGKGIIKFIEKNEKKYKVFFDKKLFNYSEFLMKIKVQKENINTIADLRRLWTDPSIGKYLRIMSNLFFRKHALKYIFNSRISNYASHIKYRMSLWSALKDPQGFNHIKQF